MEVKKLVCDVCGGQIEMQSGGKGICTSCGTPFSADIIKDKIQEIRGTIKVDGPVETVKGDAEKERLLNMANDCLNKGNLEEARRIYKIASQEYSNDWRGWWGIIRSTPLQKNYVINFLGRMEPEALLNHEFEMAISFAPENQKNAILQHKQQRNKNIEKIKINDEIDQLNSKIENIDKSIKSANSTIANCKQEFDKNTSRHIIGGILIAIAIITLLITHETSAFGTALIVSIIIGAIGICIWNWKPIPGYIVNSNNNAKKSLGEYAKERKQLELQVVELNNKLNKFN